MKQTAVEWLKSEILFIDWENSYWNKRLKQAKEMENQQKGYSQIEVLEIIESFMQTFPTNPILTEDFDNWFKQFKKK
jgi:hypothetical protein